MGEESDGRRRVSLSMTRLIGRACSPPNASCKVSQCCSAPLHFCPRMPDTFAGFP